MTVPLTARARQLAASAMLAVLVAVTCLTACGGGNSAQSRFAGRLRQLGLSSQEASCVSDHLYSSLSSQEVAALFSAAKAGGGNEAALPLSLRQKLYAAVVPCAPSPASGVPAS